MRDRSNIIDFDNLLNAPAPDCVYVDEEGTKWFRFFVDYSFEGKGYTFDLWAKSLQDADKRLDEIAKSGFVSGRILDRNIE